MTSSAIDWTRRLAALLFLCFLTPAARAADGPRLSVERAVLRTTAGDLLIAFYPDLAPQSVKQVESLIASGAYENAGLTYVSQGFVAQFSVDDASLAAPLLPAERSLAMHHKRGTVSLTHADNNENSGKASFFISLDEHPELDGKYTVIGEVVDGFGTLDALDATPADEDGNPTTAVTLTKASLLKTPAEQFTLALMDGHAPGTDGHEPSPETLTSGPIVDLTKVMVASLATIVGLAGLGLVLRRWFGAGAMQSCLIGSALVASISLMAYATPRLAGHGVWAAAGLAGVIGLLRLLGRFEVGRTS